MVKCCCNTFSSCFFWLNGHNDSGNCVFLATISIGHRIPQPPSLCRCSAKLLYGPPLIRSSCHCSNDLVSALSLFYEIMMIYDRYIVRQMTWQRPPLFLPLFHPSLIAIYSYFFIKMNINFSFLELFNGFFSDFSKCFLSSISLPVSFLLFIHFKIVIFFKFRATFRVIKKMMDSGQWSANV